MSINDIYQRMVRELSDDKISIDGIYQYGKDFVGMLSKNGETNEEVIVYHSGNDTFEMMHIMTAMITYPEGPKNLLEKEIG